MSALEWIALGLAVALGIYLFYALLRAEDF
jgi:K+-transporting ATPase KdpF subunit